MRDIAASEAPPSVTRVSDAYETAFSFATQEAARARSTPQVQGDEAVPAAPARLRRGAMCLSFIGYEGTGGTSRRSASSSARSSPARRRRHRLRPGRALRPEEVRHPLHPRLPARPRALADVSETSARGAGCRGSTTTSRPPRMPRSTRSACRAGSCATSRTPTTRAHASTSRSRSSPRRRDAARAVRRVKSAIQQAFIDSGATLSHHHAVGTSTRAGSRRTSRRPVSR